MSVGHCGRERPLSSPLGDSVLGAPASPEAFGLKGLPISCSHSLGGELSIALDIATVPPTATNSKAGDPLHPVSSVLVPSINFCFFPFVSTQVIGRGGEQINKIQQDSGCKVQISPGMSEPDWCQEGGRARAGPGALQFSPNLCPPGGCEIGRRLPFCHWCTECLSGPGSVHRLLQCSSSGWGCSFRLLSCTAAGRAEGEGLDSNTGPRSRPAANHYIYLPPELNP